jgi:hypothetical protein
MSTASPNASSVTANSSSSSTNLASSDSTIYYATPLLQAFVPAMDRQKNMVWLNDGWINVFGKKTWTVINSSINSSNSLEAFLNKQNNEVMENWLATNFGATQEDIETRAKTAMTRTNFLTLGAIENSWKLEVTGTTWMGNKQTNEDRMVTSFSICNGMIQGCMIADGHCGDQCADYLTVIKSPMDFGTIRKKISKYSEKAEFISDCNLVFSNCRIYNKPGTLPAVLCERVDAYWKQLLEQYSFDAIPDSNGSPSKPVVVAGDNVGSNNAPVIESEEKKDQITEQHEMKDGNEMKEGEMKEEQPDQAME